MAGIKRNIQEMYNNNNNHNGMNMSANNGVNLNANGNGMANSNASMNDQLMNDMNEAKKTRLDNQNIKQEASRVVHLRNIPQQLSENEIIFLGLAFGNIKNVLFLRSKNQAFLEFENLPEAQHMINHFNTSTATFNGKKIFVQYSNHQELNTDPNNSNNLMAQAALNEAVQLHKAAKFGGKNTVLRATVLNMIYPVTLDVINQIFSKFGLVLKLITFNKNDKFQVLIQMRDPMAAQNAKMSLHGQNIYNGCCTLQIDFSKLATLEVRYNNEKSRDYTNLLLPSGDGQAANGTNANGNSSYGGGNMQNDSLTGSAGGLMGMSSLGGGGGSSSMNNSQHQMMSMSGSNMSINSMNGNSMMPYSQQQPSLIGQPPSSMFSSSQMSSYSNSQSNMGSNMNSLSNNMNMNMNNSLMPQQQQQQQQQHNMPMANGATTPVLLVSNLNEEFVTPEALFTLFGVYGDVVRVKILFNKKDSALINFANAQQASTALANLDRTKLWNKQIRVFPSKHLTVQMPKEGQPDSGLTKDFSNSPLHRFKKPGSKNFNNIFPPSSTLHLSNIPSNITDQQIKELFVPYGNVRGFKFFQKDRKMALLQMETTEEAINALIATHNYQLADNMHLRVTFSKATI